MALWGGRFSQDTHELVARFSESISYDQRLYDHDITGSLAHARMLARQGIIPAADSEAIIAELERIRARIAAGEFVFQTKLEDIHMNIEASLIAALGDAGARVHTARSRNDQVATDIRLYLRDELSGLIALVRALQRSLLAVAQAHPTQILPGFTHLQHAQPVLLAHHLLAYVEMLDRDAGRFHDARVRLNECPLGAGALAGTTLPIDREFTARELGFAHPMRNSMDAVSARDFAIEIVAALAINITHLSRLAEDLIFWSTPEAGFAVLGDAFCTGSSLMPQKKNPDIAELTRGKTGRVNGALVSLLTLMKGLPLCYNRDLQEDKEALFDALDTAKLVLATWAPMLRSLKVNGERMRAMAADPALMATDLAEWLVRQGLPFRTAHHRVGRFVGWCAEHKLALNQVTLAQMRETIPEAQDECLALFSPEKSVAAREVYGGTGPRQVASQMAYWEEKLGKSKA